MGSIVLKTQTAPATPASGYTSVYIDSADGALKYKNDAGTVISTAAAATYTTGSVLFADGSGLPSQNNANLFWDNSLTRLGIGTDSPISTLHVAGSLRVSTFGAGVLVSDAGGGVSSASLLSMALGGTGKSLTAANGAIVYSDADSFELSAVGTSGQILISGGAGAPTWFDPASAGIAHLDVDGVLSSSAVDLTSEVTNRLPWANIAAGTTGRMARFDGTGDLNTVDQYQIDDDGLLNISLLPEPNGLNGSFSTFRSFIDIIPLQNSPDETWIGLDVFIDLDSASTGFTIGTNGTAARSLTNNFRHKGTSDVGELNFFSNNFDVGNGTDPIDVNGVSYCYGFGAFAANVNISGPMQGYGFQPNINAAATIDSGVYTNAFYDSATYGCATPGYTSYNASPTIASINSTTNYQAFNVNATITALSSNAGVTGVGVYPTIGSMAANSYFQGVNVNPTITGARAATGIQVSLDNVTAFAGVQASLVIQDLTITADLVGATQNGVTIEYTTGGTAGSEVVSNVSLAFTVQIEDGVSTATQVAAALNGFLFFTQNLSVSITGTASDPQVAQAPTNLTGGQDAGNLKAAYLDGDVEITGSLTFGGALSIGALNAFFSEPLVDGGGNPNSVHSLISSGTVAASATVANADTIGVNTAMLLSIGDNATVTTAFLGVAALGLPAVVSMGTGSTIDRVSGATFAISLDATATGGTIDHADLCRALVLPNGVTAITELVGYRFDLPFGDPGTTTWGFYSSVDCFNYFNGNLKIGSGADTVANSDVGLEIGGQKAFIPGKVTTAQRNALTALEGMVVYDTDDQQLYYHDGTSWIGI